MPYIRRNNIMENLITDLKTCVGQKLIDADNMQNDYIILDDVDKLSFIIYVEILKEEKSYL